MRTALDTNILSGQTVQQTVQAALLKARRQGSIVLSGAAYGELLAHPALNRPVLDRLLERGGISADFAADLPFWLLAGEAYAAYARRRRTSGGGTSRRILTDFLIGAHASLRVGALMTLDSQHYRLSFPNLKLVVPT